MWNEAVVDPRNWPPNFTEGRNYFLRATLLGTLLTLHVQATIFFRSVSGRNRVTHARMRVNTRLAAIQFNFTAPPSHSSLVPSRKTCPKNFSPLTRGGGRIAGSLISLGCETGRINESLDKREGEGREFSRFSLTNAGPTVASVAQFPSIAYAILHFPGN